MKGLSASSLRGPVAHQIFYDEIGYDNHKPDANTHDNGTVIILLVTWCIRSRRDCKGKVINGFEENKKAAKIKNHVKYFLFH